MSNHSFQKKFFFYPITAFQSVTCYGKALGIALLSLLSINTIAQNDCGIPQNQTTLGEGFTGTAVYNISSASDARDRGANYLNTYSSFGYTGVAIVHTFSETIIFNNSDKGDSVTITAQLPLSITASVLNNIYVQAYNGTTAVGSAQSITGLLQALNLLTSFNGKFTAGFVPDANAAFDRITISSATFVGVGAFTDYLRIYDVAVQPTAPRGLDIQACSIAGPANTVSVQSPQGASAFNGGTGFGTRTYYWYASPVSTTPLAITTSASPNIAAATVLPNLTPGTKTVYVTTYKDGCTNDTSLRAPVNFNVLAVSPNVSKVCNGTITTLSAAPTGGSGGYTYSWTTTGGNISGTTNTNSITIMSNGFYTVTVNEPQGCAYPQTVAVANYSANCNAVILPILNLQVKARLLSGTPQVSWTTETEINSRSFEIEKSADGSRFTTVGSVAAAGNSTVTRTYSFTDNSSNSTSLVYYRIKAVDRDGKAAYSDMVTLRLTGANTGTISIFPNPVRDLLNIETTVGNYQVELYKLDGRKLLSVVKQNVSGIISLPVTTLSAGTYQVKLTDLNSRKIAMSKVIIAR